MLSCNIDIIYCKKQTTKQTFNPRWWINCTDTVNVTFTVKFNFQGSNEFLSWSGGRSCTIVCPFTHRCSVSVSACGLSVSTRRSNLARWSRTDPSSADKLYLAQSSCVCAGIFSPALHKSAALHTEGNISRFHIELKSLTHRKYVSDNHTGALWSY